MIGQNVRNHIVRVALVDDDALIFGPYTKRAAEEVARKINEVNEARSQDEQNADWLHATAREILNPGPTDASAIVFPKANPAKKSDA